MTTTGNSGPLAARIRAGRSELEGTLDAIEDKINLPKQIGKLTAKSKASYEGNPVPWFIGAAAAVVTIGGLIALAVSRED